MPDLNRLTWPGAPLPHQHSPVSFDILFIDLSISIEIGKWDEIGSEVWTLMDVIAEQDEIQDILCAVLIEIPKWYLGFSEIGGLSEGTPASNGEDGDESGCEVYDEET